MRFLVALGAAALLGCASPVSLDRYRGAFSTHFDGVPDQAQVCAVVTNGGDEPVERIRLRLRSWSAFGEEPARFTSWWNFRARLEPGESVAIELPDPPVAEQIELDLRATGTGPSIPPGRLARRTESCSDESLRTALGVGNRGRTADGQELHAAVRRDAADEVLLAQGEDADPNR